MPFYKNNDGNVLKGVTEIIAPTYSKKISEKDNYDYPIEGWYFYEDDKTAYSAFGLELPSANTVNTLTSSNNRFMLNK